MVRLTIAKKFSRPSRCSFHPSCLRTPLCARFASRRPIHRSPAIRTSVSRVLAAPLLGSQCGHRLYTRRVPRRNHRCQQGRRAKNQERMSQLQHERIITRIQENQLIKQELMQSKEELRFIQRFPLTQYPPPLESSAKYFS